MNISVVIPCHNAGRWIGQALRSVAAQTCPPVEIILVDDDSSDDSVEQIKASGVAVRVLPAQVQNAAAARNLGIEAATGDWIALLDADDVWYPNHLQRTAMLLENSDDVALIGNNDFIDAQGRLLPRPPGFTCSITNPTGHLPAPRFVELLANGFHFGHSTVVYRRSRLLECGLFDPQQRRRHDIDLFLRVIHNHTWAYDSRPLDQISHRYAGKHFARPREVRILLAAGLAEEFRRLSIAVDGPVDQHGRSPRHGAGVRRWLSGRSDTDQTAGLAPIASGVSPVLPLCCVLSAGVPRHSCVGGDGFNGAISRIPRRNRWRLLSPRMLEHFRNLPEESIDDASRFGNVRDEKQFVRSHGPAKEIVRIARASARGLVQLARQFLQCGTPIAAGASQRTQIAHRFQREVLQALLAQRAIANRRR